MSDIEQIKIDEGFRSLPYMCTAGKMTIGYGLNLEEGISEDTAHLLLKDRLLHNKIELKRALPWFLDEFSCDGEVYAIISNMQYNLGLPRLLRFKKMWSALEEFDYKTAAAEMRDSLWHSQVGDRAERLAKRMEALGG
jgi:lysozyme